MRRIALVAALLASAPVPAAAQYCNPSLQPGCDLIIQPPPVYDYVEPQPYGYAPDPFVEPGDVFQPLSTPCFMPLGC